MKDDPSYICILDIHDRPLATRYLGKSLVEAAMALHPGTIHGSGASPEHAPGPRQHRQSHGEGGIAMQLTYRDFVVDCEPPLPPAPIPVVAGIDGPVIGHADNFTVSGNRVLCTIDLTTETLTQEHGLKCTARETVLFLDHGSK